MSSLGEESSEMDKDDFSKETKRVQYLIDNLMERLQFAMTIPVIIDKCFPELTECFSEMELGMIKKAFCKYNNNQGTKKSWAFKKMEERADFTCLHSTKEIEKYFNDYVPKDLTIPKSDEYDISKAIQIFYGKEKIRKLAKNYRKEISEGAKKFLNCLNSVIKICLDSMQVTPESAAMKEKTLRKIFNRYSDLSDYNNFAEEIKEVQFNRDVSFFDKRIKELQAWEITIDNMKDDAREYIEKIQEETDETLLSDLQIGNDKKEIALAEIETDMTNLENLRKKNIDEEKELRIKRYKTEQQLIHVLHLYDRDLIERQNIYDGKKAAFEVEKAVLQEFQQKYDEQTAIYTTLMAEKKAYEDQLIQGRLYELRCKMAARKIQKCFKRYSAVAGMCKGTDGRKSSKKSKKSIKPVN